MARMLLLLAMLSTGCKTNQIRTDISLTFHDKDHGSISIRIGAN